MESSALVPQCAASLASTYVLRANGSMMSAKCHTRPCAICGGDITWKDGVLTDVAWHPFLGFRFFAVASSGMNVRELRSVSISHTFISGERSALIIALTPKLGIVELSSK